MNNVLIIFSSGDLGGAEKSLTRMAKNSRGLPEIALCTMGSVGAWSKWAEELNLQPIVLNKKMRKNYNSFNISTIWNLVKLIRERNFNILYVIGFRASIVVRFLRLFLKNIKIIHGIRWNPDSNSKLDKILRLIEYSFGFLINLYICNSEICAKTLTRRAGISSEKIKVIHNGLDWTLNPYEKNNSRNNFNIVVLANISPRKGHIEFLEVIKGVCEKLPNAHFFFVGNDNNSESLIKKISLLGLNNSITLTGFQDDVRPWLEKAKIMVLPSQSSEGCPTSIIEGFAYKLPVVAYSVDGIPELISNNCDGILIPVGDSSAMRNSIIELLTNDDLSNKMGLSGYQKVKNSFTLDQCSRKHQEVFSRLIENKF